MHDFPEGTPIHPYDFGEPVADGAVTPHQVGGLSPDETALHIPSVNALSIADGAIRYGDELDFVPDQYLDDPDQDTADLLPGMLVLGLGVGMVALGALAWRPQRRLEPGACAKRGGPEPRPARGGWKTAPANCCRSSTSTSSSRCRMRCCRWPIGIMRTDTCDSPPARGRSAYWSNATPPRPQSGRRTDPRAQPGKLAVEIAARAERGDPARGVLVLNLLRDVQR